MNHPGREDLPPNWRWRRSALGDDAVRCFASAVAAVAPGPAVERALSGTRATRFTHLLALGKAAVPMAEAATRWQLAQERVWRASLVVAPVGNGTTMSGLTLTHGDHPVPGPHSVDAGGAIARFAGQVTGNHHVLLLLSGGTTSLAGAPITGVSLESLQEVFRTLLGSGLDIGASNLVRKRFLRWGGGRLAAALAPAAVQALAISDVPDDDPATIGSGPVSPDGSTANDAATVLRAQGIVLPADAEEMLVAQRRDRRKDIPPPDDPCFARVTFQVIASSGTAIEAAARTTRALGYATSLEPNGLRGEAREAGARLAQRLRGFPPGEPRALILGGETTVTLGASSGTGGRNQELALSAAKELQGATGVALLAAGTDGKDGNSPNAGGLVDGTTWARIADAASRLQRHESTAALVSAGAEFLTGPTGTNVMDVVVALRAES